MRTLSIMALTSFVILWGVYSLLNGNTEIKTSLSNGKDTMAYRMKRRDLDKIGRVINDQNVNIDSETKNTIKIAKKVFDVAQNLSEKQNLLEQSFLDKASSIKDIKRLQNEIVEIKNQMKVDTFNTEKWDPKFVYYLMIQENYSYQEINAIKSLGDNGLNPEEIDYITELIKEAPFMDRISAFKNHTEDGRAIASAKKKAKEKDDFIDDPSEGASLESKLIEMNYNQEEKEEMVYGNNQ